MCEFVLRKFSQTKHRITLCAVLLLLLLLIWLDMAVGVFGTEFGAIKVILKIVCHLAISYFLCIRFLLNKVILPKG